MFPQGIHNPTKSPGAEDLSPPTSTSAMNPQDPLSFSDDRSPQWCARSPQRFSLSSDLQPRAHNELWAEGAQPPCEGLDHNDSWSIVNTSRGMAGNSWDVDSRGSFQASWGESLFHQRGEHTFELSAYSVDVGTASNPYDHTSATGFHYMESSHLPSLPLPETPGLDLGPRESAAKTGQGNYQAAGNWLPSPMEQSSSLGLPCETSVPEPLPGPSAGHPQHSSSDKVSPIGLKLKAYDWPPQEDPSLERRRRRALKALHSRKRVSEKQDNMRKELESINKEIDTLKSEKQMRMERIVKLKERVSLLQSMDD